MERFLGMPRTVMLRAQFVTLGGCQTNPQRPDASAYGDPPHDYEQPAKDAVAALPYFNSHSDTWHFVTIGAPYRAYSNGMPDFITSSSGMVTWLMSW
jgi:hypothetical protein